LEALSKSLQRPFDIGTHEMMNVSEFKARYQADLNQQDYLVFFSLQIFAHGKMEEVDVAIQEK
jgi:hypothetical protein